MVFKSPYDDIALNNCFKKFEVRASDPCCARDSRILQTFYFFDKMKEIRSDWRHDAEISIFLTG